MSYSGYSSRLDYLDVAKDKTCITEQGLSLNKDIVRILTLFLEYKSKSESCSGSLSQLVKNNTCLIEQGTMQ